MDSLCGHDQLQVRFSAIQRFKGLSSTGSKDGVGFFHVRGDVRLAIDQVLTPFLQKIAISLAMALVAGFRPGDHRIITREAYLVEDVAALASQAGLVHGIRRRRQVVPSQAGEELGLGKMHIRVARLTVLPREQVPPAYPVCDGRVAGDTLHLVIGHVVLVEEFGIIEALEKVGLPVTVDTLLERHRRVAFDGVHMAGFTGLVALDNSGVVVAQLAALLQENLIGVTGLAVIQIGLDLAILHVAEETGLLGHQDVLSLHNLRMAAGAA